MKKKLKFYLKMANNSFDTKIGLTAKKYITLDNIFVKLAEKNKFERIITSVVTNKNLLMPIDLRKDITSQVISYLSNMSLQKINKIYYLGDVFKKDLNTFKIKQFREHGLEHISENTSDLKYKLVINILLDYLISICGNNFNFILSDPMKKNNNHKFDNLCIEIKKNTKLSKMLNRTFINKDKSFFSKKYHHSLYFYAYSSHSKKILCQGGMYNLTSNKKKYNCLGFSCNVDNLVELI